MFEKGLKYVGNDVDVWEMAQRCGEMTKLFEKRLENVEYGFEIWKLAKIFEKWLRSIGHGQSI